MSKAYFLEEPKMQPSDLRYQIAPVHGGMCHPPQSEAVRRDLLEQLGDRKFPTVFVISRWRYEHARCRDLCSLTAKTHE